MTALPSGISHRRFMDSNLLYEGVVITIEPGLYVETKWGIRIENVYEVSLTSKFAVCYEPMECFQLVSASVPSGAAFLTFRPLTWLPIQREIIDVSLLEERHVSQAC